MVVVLSGVPVLVVLNEKHEVRRSVSAKLLIPISVVVFIEPHYTPETSLDSWGNA
jgi:hypothetical protein